MHWVLQVKDKGWTLTSRGGGNGVSSGCTAGLVLGSWNTSPLLFPAAWLARCYDKLHFADKKIKG